jgi:hypothetical protein
MTSFASNAIAILSLFSVSTKSYRYRTGFSSRYASQITHAAFCIHATKNPAVWMSSIWPFQACAPLLATDGMMEDDEEVRHLVANWVEDFIELTGYLQSKSKGIC